jgi:hypothetical protein
MDDAKMMASVLKQNDRILRFHLPPIRCVFEGSTLSSRCHERTTRPVMPSFATHGAWRNTANLRWPRASVSTSSNVGMVGWATA